MGKIVGLDGEDLTIKKQEQDRHELTDEEFAELVAGRLMDLLTTDLHPLEEGGYESSPRAEYDQLEWAFRRLAHIFKVQEEPT